MSCTSSEPCRTSPYSEDLRWKMVWQKEVLGFTYSKITVIRTLELFWMTGQLAKRPYPSKRAYRDLTGSVQIFIINTVVEKPLEEIKKELEDFMMVDISVSTICKFLHKNGFTSVLLQHSKMLC